MQKMFLSIFLALLSVAAILVLPAKADRPADTLIVNTPVLPPFTTKEEDGFEDLLAKEMYQRAGLKMDIHHVPSERGLINMNSGLDDGVMSRIRGLEKFYKNAVIIDESVIVWRFVAFSRDRNIQISGWQSLAPYNVGIVNGWKVLESNITGVKSLIKVDDVGQLFNLLVAGRIDLAIYAEQPGRFQIRAMGREDISVLEPPLTTREKFFYVHKNHLGIVEKLRKALLDMKHDGAYNRIRKQTLLTDAPQSK